MKSSIKFLPTIDRRHMLARLAASSLILILSTTVASTLYAQTGVCYDEFPGLPIILGSSVAETLNGTNSSERICGLQGSDIIRANGGDDKVVGNEGNDNINGGEGNDFLRGGKDDDTVNGWSGNDTIFGDLGNDSLDGSNGEDLIYGGDGNDIANGGLDNDMINGENGIDIINGYYGNDTLNGNAGNDTINGDSDNDSVYGGQNDDTVRGGYGADNVVGDSGNDRIYGDRDNDNLWGGSGVDTFHYYYGDGHDVVWDFQLGVDKVRLLNISRMSTRREGADCIVSIDQTAAGTIRVKNVPTCTGILSAADAEVLPTLTINTEAGASGSIFTIIGSGFIPAVATQLMLNETSWATVQADATGSFALQVDTKHAAFDVYSISVPAYQQTDDEMSLTLDPVAVQFALSPDGVIQAEETVIGISSTAIYRLSLQQTIYLPLVQDFQE